MNKFLNIIVVFLSITNLNSQSKVTVPENALIKSGSVGNFKIGNEFPKNLQNGTISKKMVVGEEGEEIPIAVISLNNQEYLHLIPEVDFNYEYHDFINSIIIKNALFKTEKEIGIGSTISKFIVAYDDYSIWYSYISGVFVLSSNGLNRVNFILDVDEKTEKSLWEHTCLDCEEVVFIDLGVIDTSLKIKEIRLY